uniref:Protein kinase domain-containing protein n=1 Tax=Macrostomum lignano TaxID=282301 RepID=A0A1I8HWU9_9PLAT
HHLLAICEDCDISIIPGLQLRSTKPIRSLWITWSPAVEFLIGWHWRTPETHLDATHPSREALEGEAQQSRLRCPTSSCACLNSSDWPAPASQPAERLASSRPRVSSKTSGKRNLTKQKTRPTSERADGRKQSRAVLFGLHRDWLARLEAENRRDSIPPELLLDHSGQQPQSLTHDSRPRGRSQLRQQPPTPSAFADAAAFLQRIGAGGFDDEAEEARKGADELDDEAAGGWKQQQQWRPRRQRRPSESLGRRLRNFLMRPRRRQSASDAATTMAEAESESCSELQDYVYTRWVFHRRWRGSPERSLSHDPLRSPAAAAADASTGFATSSIGEAAAVMPRAAEATSALPSSSGRRLSRANGGGSAMTKSASARMVRFRCPYDSSGSDQDSTLVSPYLTSAFPCLPLPPGGSVSSGYSSDRDTPPEAAAAVAAAAAASQHWVTREEDIDYLLLRRPPNAAAADLGAASSAIQVGDDDDFDLVELDVSAFFAAASSPGPSRATRWTGGRNGEYRTLPLPPPPLPPAVTGTATRTCQTARSVAERQSTTTQSAGNPWRRGGGCPDCHEFLAQKSPVQREDAGQAQFISIIAGPASLEAAWLATSRRAELVQQVTQATHLANPVRVTPDNPGGFLAHGRAASAPSLLPTSLTVEYESPEGAGEVAPEEQANGTDAESEAPASSCSTSSPSPSHSLAPKRGSRRPQATSGGTTTRPRRRCCNVEASWAFTVPRAASSAACRAASASAGLAKVTKPNAGLPWAGRTSQRSTGAAPPRSGSAPGWLAGRLTHRRFPTERRHCVEALNGQQGGLGQQEIGKSEAPVDAAGPMPMGQEGHRSELGQQVGELRVGDAGSQVTDVHPAEQHHGVGVVQPRLALRFGRGDALQSDSGGVTGLRRAVATRPPPYQLRPDPAQREPHRLPPGELRRPTPGAPLASVACGQLESRNGATAAADGDSGAESQLADLDEGTRGEDAESTVVAAKEASGANLNLDVGALLLLDLRVGQRHHLAVRVVVADAAHHGGRDGLDDLRHAGASGCGGPGSGGLQLALGVHRLEVGDDGLAPLVQRVDEESQRGRHGLDDVVDRLVVGGQLVAQRAQHGRVVRDLEGVVEGEQLAALHDGVERHADPGDLLVVPANDAHGQQDVQSVVGPAADVLLMVDELVLRHQRVLSREFVHELVGHLIVGGDGLVLQLLNHCAGVLAQAGAAAGPRARVVVVVHPVLGASRAGGAAARGAKPRPKPAPPRTEVGVTAFSLGSGRKPRAWTAPLPSFRCCCCCCCIGRLRTCNAKSNQSGDIDRPLTITSGRPAAAFPRADLPDNLLLLLLLRPRRQRDDLDTACAGLLAPRCQLLHRQANHPHRLAAAVSDAASAGTADGWSRHGDRVPGRSGRCLNADNAGLRRGRRWMNLAVGCLASPPGDSSTLVVVGSRLSWPPELSRSCAEAKAEDSAALPTTTSSATSDSIKSSDSTSTSMIAIGFELQVEE